MQIYFPEKRFGNVRYYAYLCINEMRQDMDTNIKNAIFEINKVINEYVHTKKLFSGGCCYSAYLIANALKRLGVEYKVVLFQSGENASEREFANAIDGDCDHVAIEVRIGLKKLIIGDYSGITKYYETMGFVHELRKYDNISPRTLRNAYYGKSWNCIYDTTNNRPLSAIINGIVDKYTKDGSPMRKVA